MQMNCSNILRPFGLGQGGENRDGGMKQERKRKKDVCIQTETQKGNETVRHVSWHRKQQGIQTERRGEWDLGNILRKEGRCG